MKLDMRDFTPQSRGGWAAGWFAAVAAISILVGQVTAGVSMIGAESPRATTGLAVVALIAAVCLLGGLAAGIVAWTRGDHSAPVLVALALGVAAMLFLVGEFVFPH